MSKSEKPTPSVSPVSPSELQARAFELYVARRAHAPRAIAQHAKSVAGDCFIDAAAFLQTAQEISEGTFEPMKPAAPQLDDVCAPNLLPTHPLNMVSRQYGNPETVRKVAERIEAGDLEGCATQYGWPSSELNRAKDLFPMWAARLAVAN